MKRKTASAVAVSLLFVAFQIGQVVSQSVGSYIPVPYHHQIRYYYCGPACLEMVFDFYGPDISQEEIAVQAGTTEPSGTYTDMMRRAAHVGRYSRRNVGYAAFEHGGLTMGELKSLVDMGYPIVVLTWFSEVGVWGHYRVVVGYNDTHVTLHDPWFRPNQTMTYPEFLWFWEYSYYWGLFVNPWNVSVIAPENVQEGDVFIVTATITYPCPPPFYGDDYPASSSSAIITLSPGLSLVSTDDHKKPLGAGDLAAGSSATVNWTLRADSLGTHFMQVEAEGEIFSVSPRYRARIGGFSNVSLTVSPLNPMKAVENLIQVVESWSVGTGIETSLVSKLQTACRSLNRENQNASIGELTAFMNQVQALRDKKLTDQQANYLIAEVQAIKDSLQG